MAQKDCEIFVNYYPLLFFVDLLTLVSKKSIFKNGVWTLYKERLFVTSGFLLKKRGNVMKKIYEKPVLVFTEDMAEGIFAASGASLDGSCWTASAESSQDYVDGNHIFRIKATHTPIVEHISTACTFTVPFNYPIQSCHSENDWQCTPSGNNVIVTRVNHANAYKSGDETNFGLWVSTGDEATTKNLVPGAISCSCTKTVNVQGGGADGN